MKEHQPTRNKIPPFDLLHSPLEGTNLIEASAGTGKTYTITALFLRLILERHLPVEQILVVTFTQAATEELKHRIRSRLREAIAAFASGTSDDPFLEGLLGKIGNANSALGLLRIALRGFDQAAISTIHGFCLRMLHENAFESGSLFDTELVTDQETLKQDIIEDFWRQNFYNASPLFTGYALNRKFTPYHLGELLTKKIARPYMKVIPEASAPDPSLAERAYTHAFREMASEWSQSRGEVSAILASSPALHRSLYGPSKALPLIDSMDSFVRCGELMPVLFSNFERFTTTVIQGATKKNHEAPSHPFFALCETLKEQQARLETAYEKVLLGLQADFLTHAEAALSLRKARDNIQSFDDLLTRLNAALKGRGGARLAQAIRQKFKAALIDEFQDTDPIQYEIFKGAFAGEGSTLFLIGDPKQAIYGFRGADVFAYMKASADVASRHTLLANWRSDPGLIRAVNALCSKARLPFVYEGIPFFPAAAARRDNLALTLSGRSDPPLELWLLDADRMADAGKAISKGQARDTIIGAVAAEISRLLHLAQKGEAILGDQPLREQHIAVLVRTNKEAQSMQKALAALRIPSVLYSTANLFDSHEAVELERVLAAIHDPGDPALLKAVLVTDMLGWNGEELSDLIADEYEWEARFEAFRGYHEMWRDRGFVRMFRHLLSEEKVLPRLMAFPDGERRNTNLLHLGEVLHRAGVEKEMGMTALLKWLGGQRHPDTPRLEEHQLRLESDENAVRLVTIHKSKGLEYPVVFCPFMWAGSHMTDRDIPFMFHDAAEDMRLTLDLGSEAVEANKRTAERENLAENLRLLYVGLTRGKCRCYLVWGRINEADTSAPAYLFHQPRNWDPDNILNGLKERFQPLDDRGVQSDLQPMVQDSKGAIRLRPLPETPGELNTSPVESAVKLMGREFQGEIDRTWRITSFSSLIGRRQGAEVPDHDEATETPPEEEVAAGTEQEPAGIFAFPKGARAGTFLHDLLEHLDFTERDDGLVQALVIQKLARHGFPPEWLETIGDMIKRLGTTPLERGVDLTFSSIDSQNRLNEMEFYFPLRPVSPDRLRKILEAGVGSGPMDDFPATIERLRFDPCRGFMRGFMDMVFHWQGRFFLVDWKSNHLGNRTEDYRQTALREAMRSEYYVLQYVIYTLALDRYLSLRVPGYEYSTHFGGVYYVFLRGLDPTVGPDCGIYADRPMPELIHMLRKELVAAP